MRLWTLSPAYLDRQGLLALWREALLARKVLEGNTKGYKNHPQLNRFKDSDNPSDYIQSYLWSICEEAAARNYTFDSSKAGDLKKNLKKIKVKQGQIDYEFRHLLNKLQKRDPGRYQQFSKVKNPEINDLFAAVPGGLEDWEKTDSGIV